MKLFDLASKYSQALFNLTSSDERLEQKLQQLIDINKLFNKPYLKNFFSSPQISNDKKKNLIQEALKGKIEAGLLSFIFLLLDKKRLKYLPEIVTQYRNLIRTSEGKLKVRMLTAVPLDEETIAGVKKKLDSMYHKNTEIDNAIDPSLIGGGIIFIGNQMIDFSLKGKLNKLKQDLLGFQK